MKIKAILFDHDGTLVDSEATHYRMWQQILIEHGIELSLAEYIQYYAGIPTTANAVRMVKHYSGLSLQASKLAALKNLATERFLAEKAFPLMPGARRAIAHFKALDLSLAVVTGAGAGGVRKTINAHQLDNTFQAVISGDDVQYSKPAPDCYLLAAKQLNLNPHECIAIEDTENGVTAAVSAGITCFAVYSDMSKHHDFSQAKNTFDHLDAACEWITHQYLD